MVVFYICDIKHLLNPSHSDYQGQIKKITVFRVTGLKTLVTVGTHIFCDFFFLQINKFASILKVISPFKMHIILFFSRKPKQI